MPGIRPFVEKDVSPVADLVWKVLHEQQGPSPESLKGYFNELFLQNPWREEGILSRVYEDGEGKIIGFFGAIPRQMTVQGKPLRFAFGSNFVVDPGSRASMVAIQLVKAFMKGSQDVSITDSANENSRQLLRSLGFSIVPIYSLLWARPLRPSQYGVQGVARLRKSNGLAKIGNVVRPACSVADYIATKMSLSPFRQHPPVTSGEILSVETLLECLGRIPPRQYILPEYDLGTLGWLLQFIDKHKAFGDVRSVAVRENGRVIGWFIYYVVRGGIGEVLQVGAETPFASKVLDHLFFDAWKNGLIGLHGRLEPQFMQEMTLKSCFFLRNGSWTLAHSSKPELLSLIQGGNAFFSRLDGEWALRPKQLPSVAH